MGVAILSPVQIDVAGKKIISRRGGIEDDAGFRIEKTESNGHHKDARSDQDALRCAVNRFARQVFVHQAPAARCVSPYRVEYKSDGDQVAAVKRDGNWLVEVRGNERGGKGNQRDKKQKNYVQPQEWPIRAADKVELVVMSDPINSKHEETDGIAHEIWPQGGEMACQADCSGLLRGTGHLDFENEQSHRDGEDAIGQRLDAALRQTPFVSVAQAAFFCLRRLSTLQQYGPLNASKNAPAEAVKTE